MARPVVFGSQVTTGTGFYYLTLPIVVMTVCATLFILRSRVGRALVSVRDNDLAAEVTGINVVYYKVAAFGVASFHEHAAPGATSSAMPPSGSATPYLVNHTTATFLLDERGRLVSVHSAGSGWDALAFNLERLL